MHVRELLGFVGIAVVLVASTTSAAPERMTLEVIPDAPIYTAGDPVVLTGVLTNTWNKDATVAATAFGTTSVTVRRDGMLVVPAAAPSATFSLVPSAEIQAELVVLQPDQSISFPFTATNGTLSTIGVVYDDQPPPYALETFSFDTAGDYQVDVTYQFDVHTVSATTVFAVPEPAVPLQLLAGILFLTVVGNRR